MYVTVRILHSYWAYLALLILLIASINAIIGFTGNKDFKNRDLRISLFGLIFSHIQLLIGFILYFVSPRFALWGQEGMGGIMKDSISRLYLVEHPVINILAIVLITIGWSKHKKQETSKRKFGKIGLFYALGLILILSRIPWDIWL
ncbi:hypothetical protein GTQ40_09450 [Flavobacteriaceae bacterium R38]|nr:hypothetical protein [Flavobacteriaceae bacterium R38]